MSKITIGYWAVRGVVEPIHLFLAYKEVPFEKTSYTVGNVSQWFEKDKVNLGIEFPNIPYLIDGDIKLAQSNTILRYLENKYGSYYTGDLVHDLKLDVMIETISDMRMAFLRMCVVPGELETKKQYYLSQTLFQKWGYFDKWLSMRKFMTGNSLCVANSALWNAIDYNNLFDREILSKFKNVQRFKKDVESDPKVDAYLKKPEYKKFPITLPFASWGGNSE